ncbi:hypothetical protein GCM10022232_66310 [Streptomyces plumbiresistens]|uniref:Transposase n=1 Tax=Streptomyces plumbiresistens TaxID=511811 RepID=A0ABP7SNR6_9ACTN
MRPRRLQRCGARQRGRPHSGRGVPGAGELSKKLITEAKQTDARAWLGEVSSVVLQQSLRDAEAAYKNCGSMHIVDLVPRRVWRRGPRGAYTLVSDDGTNPDGITCGQRPPADATASTVT